MRNVFNFEGGCYAKTVGLSHEKEPEIFNAIKFGAILENTRFLPESREVDYDNVEVTENTRVSYPISYIPNAVEPSIGGIPKNIFFLTCRCFWGNAPYPAIVNGSSDVSFCIRVYLKSSWY